MLQPDSGHVVLPRARDGNVYAFVWGSSSLPERFPIPFVDYALTFDDDGHWVAFGIHIRGDRAAG